MLKSSQAQQLKKMGGVKMNKNQEVGGKIIFQSLAILGILGICSWFGIKYGWLYFTFWLIILGGGYIAVYSAINPVRCALCDVPLRKKSYTWDIKGERKRVCPECNKTLQRKRSNAAIKNAGL